MMQSVVVQPVVLQPDVVESVMGKPVVVAANCDEASHGAACCGVSLLWCSKLWSSCYGAVRCVVVGVVQPVVVLLDMVQSVGGGGVVSGNPDF